MAPAPESHPVKKSCTSRRMPVLRCHLFSDHGVHRKCGCISIPENILFGSSLKFYHMSLSTMGNWHPPKNWLKTCTIQPQEVVKTKRTQEFPPGGFTTAVVVETREIQIFRLEEPYRWVFWGQFNLQFIYLFLQHSDSTVIYITKCSPR